MADNPQPPSSPSSGILRSNVETHEVVSDGPRPRRAFPFAIVLVGLLTFVAGGATVLLLTSGRSAPQTPVVAAPTAAVSQRPTPTSPSAAQPTSRRSTAPVGAPLPAINNISCDALESTIFHIH